MAPLEVRKHHRKPVSPVPHVFVPAGFCASPRSYYGEAIDVVLRGCEKFEDFLKCFD